MLTNQLTPFIIISEVRAYHYNLTHTLEDKEMENKKLRNLLSGLQELELELVESVLESVEEPVRNTIIFKFKNNPKSITKWSG